MADRKNLFVMVVVISTILTPALATTYYVSTDGNDLNNGTSWQDAFATIQKGINTASNGDTVIVADGTYIGNGNRDLDTNGKAITVKSQNGPQNCIIDCNGSIETPHRGFVFTNFEGLDTMIKGFTIRNGYVSNDSGGAIFIWCPDETKQTSPTIENCTIYNNKAMYGGGIAAYALSNSRIAGCVIYANYADAEGGGIWANALCNMTINNCTVAGNVAGSPGAGGGLFYENESRTITSNSIIWNNRTGGMSEMIRANQICNFDYGPNSPYLPVIKYNNILNYPDSIRPYYIDINNVSCDPCFINCFLFTDNTVADGNLITLKVADASKYNTGDTIEYNNDSIPRHVNSIDTVNDVITIDSNDVFDSNSLGGSIIYNWGLGVSNVTEDFRLRPSSYSINAGDPCYSLYGNEEDLDNAARVVSGRVDIGADEQDCFPTEYSAYDDWVVLGRPDCWCGTKITPNWKYQCDGDSDGTTSGSPFNYRIYNNDLSLIYSNWQKKITDPNLNPCADIDHKSEGAEQYRVYTNDINIIIANWKKKDSELPGDCPRNE